MIGDNAKNITGAESTIVSPRPGILRRLAVGTAVGDGTVTVYDGLDTNGTVIATVTLPADVSAMPPSSLELGVTYTTGLFVVTTGAGLDVTVVWR